MNPFFFEPNSNFRAGVFDDVTGHGLIRVKIVTRGSEIEVDSVRRVGNRKVGDSSRGEIVHTEINFIGHLESSAGCLPEMWTSFVGNSFALVNLEKFPVGVFCDPGGIASLPQQRGECGSGTFGNTFAPMKPPFTPVSLFPVT